jgi:general secretion pathway protein A
MPFEARALARIHALSRGVPRRINLLCDRALLGAYAQGRRNVDRATVERAAQEVAGARPVPRGPAAAQRIGWAALAMAVMLGLGWLLGREGRAPTRRAEPLPVAATAVAPGDGSAAASPAAAVAAPAAAPPVPASLAPAASAAGQAMAARAAAASAEPAASDPSAALPARPASVDAVLAGAWRDEASAWRALAPAWGVVLAGNGPRSADAPCVQAVAVGLACFRSAEGLTRLRQLDRPVWLRLVDARGRAAYVLLLGVGNDAALLAAGVRRWRLPLIELAQRWRGEFATFWRPPPGGPDGPRATAQAAAVLAARPAAAGPPGAASAPAATAATAAAAATGRDAVRAFQVTRGLPADGVAGPLTWMMLDRPGGAPEPRLLHEP